MKKHRGGEKVQDMSDIYSKYADMVYRYLLSLTCDSSIAEELTQETFYQAIRSSGRYDGTCRISTWLCAIAKNALHTYYRKNPQYEELPQAAETSGVDAEQTGQSAEVQALRNLEAKNVNFSHKAIEKGDLTQINIDSEFFSDSMNSYMELQFTVTMPWGGR